MSVYYRCFRGKFGLSNKNRMKEIFKSIVGMTLITALFMLFGAIIEFYAPELLPLFPVVKGFVFVTLMMGLIIISKSGIELIQKSRLL